MSAEIQIDPEREDRLEQEMNWLRGKKYLLEAREWRRLQGPGHDVTERLDRFDMLASYLVGCADVEPGQLAPLLRKREGREKSPLELVSTGYLDDFILGVFKVNERLDAASPSTSN